MEYPSDEKAYQCPGEFLFGDLLLGAPVTMPGEGEQKIEESGLSDTCVLITNSWDRITEFYLPVSVGQKWYEKHQRPIFI